MHAIILQASQILYQEGSDNNPLSQRRCDQVTQRLYTSKTKSSEAKFLEQRELLKVKSALNHNKKKSHPLQSRLEDIRIKSRLRGTKRVSADAIVPNDQHTILSVRTCHTKREQVNSSMESLPKKQPEKQKYHRKTLSEGLTRRQSEEALLKQQMQLRGKLMNYVVDQVEEPRIIDRQEYQLKKREEVSYADGLALFNKWQARQEGLAMLR